MENEKQILQIEDLKFWYTGKEFQLEISNLKINKGSKVAIFGKSGSGKTTLAHLISGILKPQSGLIRFMGQNISNLSDRERRAYRIKNIGFIFQEFELIEYLSVLDNLILPYKLNKSLSLNEETINRAKAIAGRIEIENKLHKYPNQLSGGERQRLATARALITSPALVIADEPTGNLDTQTANKVLNEIINQSSKSNSTLLMITHDPRLLESFDQVIDLNKLTNPITV
ncbi:MAG: ABC transporter ATP-binding protein [Verrucomicrobia bacterium]|nr:MAG: ABC transporter ATP-binding protein [Verrucomicrobiota bacterium]